MLPEDPYRAGSTVSGTVSLLGHGIYNVHNIPIRISGRCRARIAEHGFRRLACSSSIQFLLIRRREPTLPYRWLLLSIFQTFVTTQACEVFLRSWRRYLANEETQELPAHSRSPLMV